MNATDDDNLKRAFECVVRNTRVIQILVVIDIALQLIGFAV